MMELLKTLGKFSLVGVSGVAVNLLVYSSLVYFEMNYLAAAVIAFLFAVSNNFYWNFIWTFKDKASHKSVIRKYLEFFVISLVNLLINLAVLRLMHETLHLNQHLAQIIAISVASAFNFVGNYLLTFSNKK